MFLFGNAKSIDLKHLLSGIFNSTLEGHFLLKGFKQKIPTKSSIAVCKCKLLQNHSHQLRKKIGELLFHHDANFLYVQFRSQVLNQDPTPRSFAQFHMEFFLPISRESPSGSTLCITLYEYTHRFLCELQSTAGLCAPGYY